MFSVSFLEFVKDFLVSGLDLGEGDAVDHVLDELDSFFEGGDLNGLDVVVLGPFAVFNFSFVGAVIDSFNGLIVVLVGLFQINGSLLHNFSIFSDGVAQRSDGVFLFGNLFSEAAKGLVTGGLVS